MGNRVTIYYTEPQTDDYFLVVEANNHLPIFWILLLDSKSLLQYKNRFISSYYNEYEEYEELQLSDKQLQTNINVAKKYLHTYNIEILPLFNQFANYLLHLSKKGKLDIHMLEMANFSNPEEFIENLISDVQKIENNQSLEKIKYLNKKDFLKLVGFDDSSNDKYRFSEFSQEYSESIQNYKAVIEYEKYQYNLNRDKKNRKEHIRKIIDILFMSITGIFFSVGMLFVMFKEGISLMGIICFIMGIGCLFYAYFKFKGNI